MGDQGQGQEPTGQGTAQALGLILPLAGLAAGIVRPQTAPAFAALGQQGHYMAQQQQAQNALVQKTAEDQRKAALDTGEREGTAGTLDTLFGVKVDPRMAPTNMLTVQSASDARDKFRVEESGRQHERKVGEQAREGFGRVGALRAQVGDSADLQALEASTRNLDPATFQSAAHIKELVDTQAALAAQTKKRAEATAGVRGIQGGPTPEGTPLPENVAAYRQYVLDTGGVDPKQAETVAGQFQVPLPKLPGGMAAQREAVKPPYTHFAQVPNAQGQLTSIAVTGEPQTGKPVVSHTVVPGPGGGPAGQPQQAPSAGMAEIARSMQAIISGQPHLAMPQDRNMTPQTAAAVLTSLRAVNAAAQAQASPDLAFKIISDQRDAAAAKVDLLRAASLSKQGTDQTRAQAASDMKQEQIKLNRYDSMLEPFIQSGMRNLPGGPPPAPTTPRPSALPPDKDKRLQDKGVLSPR